MQQTTSGSKSFKIKPLLGCAGLAFTIYIILFSGVPKYNEPKAEENLSQLSGMLTQVAKIMGYESRMQYSAVQIHGFAYEKWAKVSKLSIDLMREALLGRQRFGISSDNVQLIPHRTLKNRAQLRFVDPINVLSGSDLLYVISHNLPIFYVVTGKGKKDSEAIEHHFVIEEGSHIVFTNPDSNITLNFANPLAANISLPPPHSSMIATGQSGAVQMLHGQDQWDMSSNRFHFSVSQKSPKTIETRGTVTVDDLAYTAGGHSTKPMSLNAAWVYTETRGISDSTETSEFIIERSVLTDDNLHIAASGTLDFSMDDKMPYGEVILEVNDVKLLAGTNWIADKYRKQYIAMIEKIIGDDISTRHDVIPVRREKGGVWHIGKTTLDALLEQGLLDFLIFNQVQKNDQETSQDHTS